MKKITGIYAASMSLLNKDLSLNIERTIKHSENLIEKGCHGVAFLVAQVKLSLFLFQKK